MEELIYGHVPTTEELEALDKEAEALLQEELDIDTLEQLDYTDDYYEIH
jgi:hypothetical protein